MSTFSGSTWEKNGDPIILERRPAKGPDASSSNWMGFTKKRNPMLETAFEKVVAVKGKDEVEEVLEKLEAKWRKNGASATGRMIYVLKRLVEEEDVERSVVMLRWLSEREHYQGSRKLRVTRGKVGDMIRAQGLPVPPDCEHEAPYKKPKQSVLDSDARRGERRPKKQARSKYGVRGRQ